MKRKINLGLFALALVLGLGGCSGNQADSYSDGSYSGVSSEDDNGAYGEVTITIEDNLITACEYVTWQNDGSIKDEEYGKVNGEISNQDYYDKAQLAVQAMDEYADQLVETQNIDGVEVITGATISHGQFEEAVEVALEQAKN